MRDALFAKDEEAGFVDPIRSRNRFNADRASRRIVLASYHNTVDWARAYLYHFVTNYMRGFEILFQPVIFCCGKLHPAQRHFRFRTSTFYLKQGTRHGCSGILSRVWNRSPHCFSIGDDYIPTGVLPGFEPDLILRHNRRKRFEISISLMHRKNSTPSLHRDQVQKALSKIEADLINVRTAHEHPRGFETLDLAFSSHPCPEFTQVYGLLLKGDTWAEVAERVCPTQTRTA